MNDKIRAHMALVEDYAAEYARAYCEKLYGTSKSYTKQCFADSDTARAAVETSAIALHAEQAQPGFVMVPVEPTNEMVFEGTQTDGVLDYDLAAKVYRAMIAARPSEPPKAKQPEDLHIAYMAGFADGKKARASKGAPL